MGLGHSFWQNEVEGADAVATLNAVRFQIARSRSSHSDSDDGIGDYADPDADNDGALDEMDPVPQDPGNAANLGAAYLVGAYFISGELQKLYHSVNWVFASRNFQIVVRIARGLVNVDLNRTHQPKARVLGTTPAPGLSGYEFVLSTAAKHLLSNSASTCGRCRRHIR